MQQSCDDQRRSPPLTYDELAAQEAADLPDREALSLVDPGNLLGGASPTGSSPAGAAPDASSNPTTGAPAQPFTPPGSLGSVSDKIIGTGGTSNG
jgi:hypothetical protein